MRNEKEETTVQHFTARWSTNLAEMPDLARCLVLHETGRVNQPFSVSTATWRASSLTWLFESEAKEGSVVAWAPFPVLPPFADKTISSGNGAWTKLCEGSCYSAQVVVDPVRGVFCGGCGCRYVPPTGG